MPSLEFTLMVGCPLKCTFCPQDRLRGIYGKNTKYLSLQDFKTILGKVPKHVRVDFSGMAEPWANPDATAMLRHTLHAGYSVAIYTTLYDMPPEEREAVVESASPPCAAGRGAVPAPAGSQRQHARLALQCRLRSQPAQFYRPGAVGLAAELPGDDDGCRRQAAPGPGPYGDPSSVRGWATHGPAMSARMRCQARRSPACPSITAR